MEAEERRGTVEVEIVCLVSSESVFHLYFHLYLYLYWHFFPRLIVTDMISI
jgi:hypothetical protein